MDDVTDDNERPDDSAVFETTDGKKIRLSYDQIYSYVGSKSKTTIEYGYSYDKENRETYILDIDFDALDDKLTQYKDDMKKYWKNREASYSSL